MEWKRSPVFTLEDIGEFGFYYWEDQNTTLYYDWLEFGAKWSTFVRFQNRNFPLPKNWIFC